MNRSLVCLAMLCILSLVIAGTAAADVSKDERNLEREVKRLNDTAAKPDGEKAVVKRLAVEYKTTEAQVQALRDKKLGYGEIATMLSLAQSLPGGATDANVQKVLDLRQGPPVMGWGQVASRLGTKLGKTVSQVRKTANNANREIKDDRARSDKAQKNSVPQEQATKAPEPPRTFSGEGRSLKQGSNAQ